MAAGAKALLGANPFAAGAPANQEHPLVLDMRGVPGERGDDGRGSLAKPMEKPG